jgi:DNA-binding NarL/FixJ family response regulator
MQPKKITILVVDDHPVVRHGVVSMIREFDEKFYVVGEAASPAEGLLKAEALRPDVVVTDLSFIGQNESGISLVTQLGSSQPDIRCVVITANTQGRYMVEAFKAGANAFLYKDSDGREYRKAIEAAFEGMTYFPPQLAAELDQWNRLPRLTPAEERLIAYVARGMSSKELAKEYNHVDAPKVIESRTFDQHKSNIKQKFGIDTMGGLVAFAIKYCDDHGIEYKSLKIHTKRSLFGL